MVDGLDPPEMERLVKDLPRRQVAAERHRPRRAERAGQRTPGLRGQAERAAPVAVPHQDRLDRMPVVRPEQRLHSPVARLALRLDHERRERNLGGEGLAEARREIRHRLVSRRAARRPLPHLGAAIGGFTMAGEKVVEQ